MTFSPGVQRTAAVACCKLNGQPRRFVAGTLGSFDLDEQRWEHSDWWNSADHLKFRRPTGEEWQFLLEELPDGMVDTELPRVFGTAVRPELTSLYF